MTGYAPRRGGRWAAVAAPALVCLTLLVPVRDGGAVTILSGGEASSPAHVSVSKAWSRPTVHGAHSGVVYLTLANEGAADVLTGIDSDVADVAEAHATEVVNGVARMRPLGDGVPLPAGATVSFQPEGTHIMLMGLKHQLLPDSAFTLTLHFRHAPDAVVTVKVLEPAAAPPR